VDDGSTDDTAERIAPYADRVLYHRQENAGQSAAWNKAFSLSGGDVLCILDADDVFAPGKIAAVAALYEADPGLGLVHHPLRLVGKDGEPAGWDGRPCRETVLTERRTRGDVSRALLAKGFRWMFNPASSLCLSRRVAEKVFPLETTLRGSADQMLATLSALVAPVGFLPEPLADYRIHGASFERTAYGKGDAERALKVAPNLVAVKESQARQANRILRSLGRPGCMTPWVSWEYVRLRALLDGRKPGAYFLRALSGVWGEATCLGIPEKLAVTASLSFKTLKNLRS